jgi:hypothetical protein
VAEGEVSALALARRSIMRGALMKRLFPALLVASSACTSTVLSGPPGGGGAGGGGATSSSSSSATSSGTTSSSSSTSASSSTSTSASSSSGSSGIGGGTIGGWTVGAPTVLSSDALTQLDTVAAVPGGALVGVRRFGAFWGVSFDAQRLDGDGAPLAPPSSIFQGTESASVGGIALAAAPGRAGALACEDQVSGCGFVALNDDGSAAGPRVPVGTSWQGAFGATGPGYSFLGGGPGLDPPNLVRLSAAGAGLASSVMNGFGAFQGRVDAADGSMLLAWSSDGIECSDCPLHVLAQRFSGEGVALGSPQPVFQDGSFGFESDLARVALIPVAGGNLLAWSPQNDGAFQAGAITTIPLDDAGAPAGAQSSVSPAAGRAIGGLGLAVAPNGEVILVWTQPHLGDYHVTLRARALTPEGAPLGPAVDLAETDGATVVRTVGTTKGVLAFVQTGPTVTVVSLVAPP